MLKHKFVWLRVSHEFLPKPFSEISFCPIFSRQREFIIVCIHSFLIKSMGACAANFILFLFDLLLLSLGFDFSAAGKRRTGESGTTPEKISGA